MKTQLVVGVLSVLLSWPAQAVSTAESRTAAIYILQQRPAVRACLLVAKRSTRLEQVWSNPQCQPLFLMDKALKEAWNKVVPEGDIMPMNEFSNGLRTLTAEAYGEYKALAERIEELRYLYR